MAILLNIDTALEAASVCLSDDTEVMVMAKNENQKDHAAWLHQAIRELIKKVELDIQSLEAVAVSIGPGSYTGLRIGLSAAKGLCYALNIPLITIGTLEMMALATSRENADLFCPLIDARRMEVFMAVYDRRMTQIIPPASMIVDKNSFADLLSSNKTLFSGSGSKKLQSVLFHANAVFSPKTATVADMLPLTNKFFLEKKFADLAYTEPLYIKGFFSPPR
ncbi:MAG: tRNA (adenosine(37)-N6)-threonylcarbamoyltransferase complex dimerization subunit type 1 TsaB [Bacteroidota bacterium]|nr:tRNA (adenosine(37)-N6)-threonylcarbamoyltransferase complex dimerization subunit type 1 TsaB [Bacteroidota bacterium]